MVAVGGYKDCAVQGGGCSSFDVCVTDLAEMNFLLLAGKYHAWCQISDSDLIYVWYVYVLLDN